MPNKKKPDGAQLPSQCEVKLSDAKDRTCLRCGKVFASKGKHNRICTPCRKKPDPPFTAMNEYSTYEAKENE